MTNEDYIKHFTKSWGMKIVEDGNGGYTVNGDFTVRPESKTESRSSIGRVVITEVVEWVIEVSEIVHGDRWQPDDYDIVEIGRENNLGLALCKIEQFRFKESLEAGLRELQEEMSEREFDEFCERAEKELAKTESPCAEGACSA